MEDLTLIIPAKNESESLPSVLEEIKDYSCKKIVILESIDTETINNLFENESMYLTYFVVLRFYMTFLFVRNAKVSAQF